MYILIKKMYIYILTKKCSNIKVVFLFFVKIKFYTIKDSSGIVFTFSVLKQVQHCLLWMNVRACVCVSKCECVCIYACVCMCSVCATEHKCAHMNESKCLRRACVYMKVNVCVCVRVCACVRA